jgi:MFS family permease
MKRPTLQTIMKPPGVLWRDSDFLRLWSAQTISQFGSQVSGLALPLVAIFVLHASAFKVAALSAVEFAPFVLLTLPAGVWVDRLRRRPLMIAADWGRAVALGSIPVAYAVHALTLGQLYAVGFTTGCFTVFFDIAYQSYLPSLVSRDQLSEGNAKLETTRAAAQVTGPTLAGLLVAAITAPYAVAVDAASFVGSALFAMKIKRLEPALEEPEVRPHMRNEIMVGLRYTFRHPLLRPLILQIGSQNFFINMVGALLVVYAVRVLRLSAPVIGLVFSLGNVGLLVGGPIASRLARRFGIGRIIVWGAFVTGCSYLFVAAAPKSFPIPFLVIGQFLWSAGAILYFVNGISLIQAITPDRLLGRVNASRRFAVWGVIPFGQLLAGVIAMRIGLHTAVWIGAIGGALSIVPLLLSPMRHVKTTDDALSLVRTLNTGFADTTGDQPTAGM